MNTLEILQLSVNIATIISVVVAIVAIWQSARTNRRLMNMEVFTRYTDRFEKIMADFPETAFQVRFDQVRLPPPSTELRICLLRYLNLTSEEFYLMKGGYLDKKVWKIWEREVLRTLASPLFVREWSEMKREFESYPEFVDFVEKAQRDSKSKK